MHFDLVDLKLFVRIADEKSLTRGAALVHLSLPAASLRLKNLEQSLGTRLFDRGSQGLAMRPAGQALLRHARLVLQQLDDLRADLHEYAAGLRGNLRVLVTTSAMTDFLPEALRTFLIEHPDVNIDLREKLSSEIVTALIDGACDIGIVVGDVLTNGLEAIPFRTDRLVVVTTEGHPLAARDEVAFAETLDYDFIGLQEGSALRAYLHRAAASLNRNIMMRIQLSNHETICRMVQSGIGIGVLPAFAAQRYAAAMGLRIVRLSDPWSVRELLICARDVAALPTYGRALIDLLLNEGQGGGGPDVVDCA